MSKKTVMLGIDIGGTNTVFAFVDKNGKAFYEDSIETMAQHPAEDLFKRLFERINPVLDEFDLKGIGIGAPNANYYSGKVENPPNLSWGDVDLVGLVQKHVDRAVVITNDANACALGEMLFGAAKGMRNFIAITLGTGLGSGFVVNGELVYGSNGFAGELGHIVINKFGRQSPFNKKGCLESYVSATGIVRTAIELLGKSTEKSALRSMPSCQITAKFLHELALQNDPIALEAFKITADLLGLALANAVMITAPEAIIISGGLAKAGKLLLEPVKENMEKYVIPNFRNQVKILPSGIIEGNSAVLGAAALAWTEFNFKGN